MELDFDKEINALLRKARGRTDAAAPVSAHLDADEIAAFAENALPEKTRQIFIVHFAECDRCRKILSQSILLKSEAEQSVAASPELAAPAIGRSAWRRRLFGMPAIAYTMGALVLLFSGFLGLVIWQNTGGGQSSEVSQVEQNEPYRNNANASAAATKTPYAANAAGNTANAVGSPPTVAGPVPSSQVNSVSNAVVPALPLGRAKSTPDLNEQPKSLEQRTDTKPAAPVAAAPPVKDLKEEARAADKLAESKVDRAERDTEKLKQSDEIQAMKKAAPVTTMRSTSDLPVNGRNAQTAGGAGGFVPMTRSVNGRRFAKKDGAWYDAEYHGQSTINVRRGTAVYKKLDSGLRAIADTLPGTVIAIWKGKTYRIE